MQVRHSIVSTLNVHNFKLLDVINKGKILDSWEIVEISLAMETNENVEITPIFRSATID